MVVTFLSSNLVTIFLIYSSTFLLRSVFSLLSGNLVALLFRSVLGNLPVLSVALLSVFSVAVLSGNLSAILLRNLATRLLRNLITHLPGLLATLLLGYNSSRVSNLHMIILVVTFLLISNVTQYYTHKKYARKSVTS